MATTKITKGSIFAKAINYDLENGRNREDREKIKAQPATENETVVEGFRQGQRARLLETNLIGNTSAEFAEQFNQVAAQKPNKKEPVHKVSINLKPGEHLETHEWLEVAHSYLDEMGYADCPYLVAQHREKDHEHIHIVTSKVDFNGNAVSDSFEKRRARTWAGSIEEKYNLHRTPERAAEKGLSRIEIEQSIKTKSPPPKLILQESIKKTLAANQNTPDFLDALERQNISVRVRTNEDKEISGISFGIGDRGFKGSTLGANYTWKGLQKDGLNYEFERDYERLEATSRKASRTKPERIESARIEPVRLGTAVTTSSAERIRTEDVQTDGGGIESDDRLEDQRIVREEIAGKPTERLESGNETGLDISSAGSISLAAKADKRFAEESNGELEEGNQREFRWSERFHSRENETARRDQSAIVEAVAGEETQTDIASRLRSIDWFELDEDEYFREQQSRQRSEFFEQSPVGYLLPAGAGQPTDTAPSTGADLSGTRSAVVDGNSGVDNISASDHSLADNRLLQSYGLPDSGTDDSDVYRAGTAFRASDSSVGDSELRFLELGNSISDERTGESSSREVRSFSAKLRASIEDAETTVQKTVELHDEVIAENEKQKQLEIENNTVELEIFEFPGMSL